MLHRMGYQAAWDNPPRGLRSARHAFDDEQLRVRGPLADVLWLAVLLGRPPRSGSLGALELEQHQAARLPTAFQGLDLATAHQVLPAVLCNSRQPPLAAHVE